MEQLIAMGFEEVAARQAWEASGGNQELALDLLLGGTTAVAEVSSIPRDYSFLFPYAHFC